MCSLLVNCTRKGVQLLGAPLSRAWPSISCAGLHQSSALQRHPGIIHKHGFNMDWKWKQANVLPQPYTIEPLPYVRNGGRGPNGRVELKHIGGGLKRPHFMVDLVRKANADGSPYEERVLLIHETWWRWNHIALVAAGTHKRWILASADIKVGDILKSHSVVPEALVNPVKGDSYPLGALPPDTKVCHAEWTPGDGAKLAVNPGTAVTLVRHLDGAQKGKSVLRGANRREYIVWSTCCAVIGQSYNPTHHLRRYATWGEKKWRGYKQRSGLYQKKTGRFGRKHRLPLATIDMTVAAPAPLEVASTHYTLPGRPTWRKPTPQVVHRYEGERPRFQWCTWATVR